MFIDISERIRLAQAVTVMMLIPTVASAPLNSSFLKISFFSDHVRAVRVKTSLVCTINDALPAGN